MAKISFKNVKRHSPVWLVNLTAILAVATLLLPNLIDKLPGTVSQDTKDWLHFIMEVLTALSGGITMFSRRTSNVNIESEGPETVVKVQDADK